MNILLDSDIILNLDTGVIDIIKNEFNNNEVFDMDKIRLLSNDITVMAKTIIESANINPLSLIIRDDYLDKIDKLYSELITTYLDQILRLSKYTSLERLLRMTLLNSSINPTVLCRNSTIEKFFKSEFNNIKTITNENYDLDVSQYDAVYINNYIDIINFQNFF